MDLLDFIFPKECVVCGRLGKYICDSCSSKIKLHEKQICPVCAGPAISGLTHPKCKKKQGLDGLYSIFNYKEPIPQILYKLKYKFVQSIAEELVSLDALKCPDYLRSFTLVPIPLHEKRENWRGYNQAQILSEIMAKKFSLNFERGLLKRKRETSSQVGLTKKQRKENVRWAFECPNKNLASGGNLLLFDDVWTSGATMKSCAQTLKQSGAKEVWGLTLARQE